MLVQHLSICRVPRGRVVVCQTCSPLLLFKMNRAKKSLLNFLDLTHHKWHHSNQLQGLVRRNIASLYTDLLGYPAKSATAVHVYQYSSYSCIPLRTRRNETTQGGYSLKFLVGMCRPYLQIQTQFQTKKVPFPTPVFRPGLKKSIPVFRPHLVRD